MLNKLLGLWRSKQTVLIGLFDQGVVSGGNIFIAIILTNFLGLEQYGIFTLTWMGVLFCSSLHQAIIIAPLMTIGAKQKIIYRTQYLTATFVQNCAFIFLATLLTFFVAKGSNYFFPDWGVSSYALELSAVIFAFLFNDYFRKYFFLIQKAKVALSVDIINYSLQFLGIFLLNYLNALTVSNVIGVIALALLSSQFLGFFYHPFGRFDPRLFKVIFLKHWQFSRWLAGTAVLTWLSSNYFIIAAGAIIGTEAVGAIRMSQTVIGVMTVLFLAFENIMPPKASLIYSTNGKEALLTYLKSMTVLGSFVAGIFLTGIFLFADSILVLLYQPSDVQYAYILRGFAVLNLFIFIGFPLRYLLRTLERTRPIFIAYVLSAVFSLLSADYIIKSFGLIGVVIGLVCTQIVTLLYYYISVRRDLK